MLNATDATQVTFLGEFVSRGRRWNAYSDGTVLPVIAGGNGAGDGGGQGGSGGSGGGAGDGGQGGGAAGGAGNAGAGSGGSDDRRFTQADMNATVARETQAAKTRAEQDLATALGVPVEEAKQIIADRRASDDAKKTEAERSAAAWKTAQEGAEQIKGEADRERHEAKVERALGKAGLDVDNTTMLAAGLAAVTGQLQVGADADTIKAAVEKAKTDAPQLFAGASGGGGGGQHSDAGGQRNGGGGAPTGEFGGKGKAEADRRFAAQREREKQNA